MVCPKLHILCAACACAVGDGLDLLSFVEFQRNYLAAVRMHKAALMAQRGFWSSLLRDTVSFRDLQVWTRSTASQLQKAPPPVLEAVLPLLATCTQPQNKTVQSPSSTPVGNATVFVANVPTCNLHLPKTTDVYQHGPYMDPLQANVQAMEAAEQRATAVYRQ
jgi:hypothetical protein